MKSPFNFGLANDLASLWFQAPMVIALRSQAMGMDMMTGKATNMVEFNRMFTEKASAMAESAVAMNLAMVQEGIGAATSIATGRKPKSAQKTAEAITHAAVKPYSKRVRSNARRLTAKKD